MGKARLAMDFVFIVATYWSLTKCLETFIKIFSFHKANTQPYSDMLAKITPNIPTLESLHNVIFINHVS